MRAAVYYSNQDIRIEERPRPKIGPGELLVRVEASGICGSDVMEWYRRDRVPLVLGHEISGVVEEVGAGVKKYNKGDRVACAHHVPCGKCHYCLSGHETVCDTLRRTNFDPGGFCASLRLAEINTAKGVYLLPEKVSFEEATFVEPLACILRGQRLAGGVKDKCVLVIGSGIAGILHIILARHSGAARIVATDINPCRLEAAKKFGAGLGVNAKEYSPQVLTGLNQQRLADLVIITSGAPSAITQGLESVERGGTVLFFAPVENNIAVSIPFNKLFWRQEITLTNAYAGSPQDYQQALDLIAGGKLNISKMITHRLGLAETGAGFKLVAEAKESLKVIIFPQK
ncbi:MAG: zinc-binding dehydrogenase [Candidatus Omnitrophica bacterium]|nr:zinc-binding dehydrogenase [Candidatus Omnitrophota bacterium]